MELQHFLNKCADRLRRESEYESQSYPRPLEVGHLLIRLSLGVTALAFSFGADLSWFWVLPMGGIISLILLGHFVASQIDTYTPVGKAHSGILLGYFAHIVVVSFLILKLTHPGF